MVQFQYWALAKCPYQYCHCRDGVHFQYWALAKCPYQYWHCRDGVRFQYWALAKCPYQYWHCRDGVHFQYGHLPSARTSIGIAAMEFISSTGTWQVPVPVLAWLFAAQTSEFYCTLEKLQ
jgi:hypothetical protein